MRIGTDASLETCKKDGYLMMEFKKRELMTKGKLNPDANVTFLAHLPDYILEEQYGTANPVGQKTLMTDVTLSANDVWEMYQENKESIDSCAGFIHKFPTCEYSLLSLASDIDCVMGLGS